MDSQGALHARSFLKAIERRASDALDAGLPFYATVTAVSGAQVAVTTLSATTNSQELIAHLDGVASVGDYGICIPVAGGSYVFAPIASPANRPIIDNGTRSGSFVMTGYNTGQGTTLSSAATVITTTDGYDPARTYWVEMAAEVFVTCASGVTAEIAAKRQDLSSLGIAEFVGSLPGFTSEQKISSVYAFYLAPNGLPGGNGVAANTLDCRIQLHYTGATAPTARDGATAVRMTPVG